MQLTGEEVAAAVNQVAAEQRPGQPLDFRKVATLLNERLHDNLVGRSGARPVHPQADAW